MSDVTTGSIFNPQFFMNPPWWFGRVEEKVTWSPNLQGENFSSLTGIVGWSHRYKVRVFNWHTGELDTLPPKDMAFCQVVMPVTAGSGHGGASITPSIESGSVVFGFFMDGMPGQEGYIVGVLGNSNNNVPKKRGEVAPNQSSTTPAASSGTTGTTSGTTTSTPPTPTKGPGSLANAPLPPNVDQLSTAQLTKLLDPTKTPSSEVFKAASEARQKARAAGLPAAEVERLALVATVKASRQPADAQGAPTTGNCNQGYQQFNDTYTDGDPMRAAKVPDDRIIGTSLLSITEAQHIETLAKLTQFSDSNIVLPLLDVCKENGSETKGIQRVMQNLLNSIESLKREFNQVSAFVSDVSEYSSQVQAKVLGAVQEISNYLKNIMTQTRGYVLTKLSDEIAKVAPFLFPSEIPNLYTKVEQGTSLINCLFNNLISGLQGIVSELLNNILDQFINAPLCAVQNFLSGVVDSVLGPITSTIEAVLAPINALFGSVTSFIGDITSAFDFVSGILSFFLCDESPDCVEYTEVAQSSPALPSFDINLGLPELFSDDYSASAGECSSQPETCGSPLTQIFGGGGVGGLANAIISPISSSVIGFDIVDAGFGFTSDPSAQIIDLCGTGSGASLQVNTTDDGGAGITTTGGAGISTTGGTGISTTGGAGITTTGGTGISTTGAGGGGIIGVSTTGISDPKTVFNQTIIKELTSTKKIKNITILSPGDGYLPAPDGSLGGGGRVWKEPDEGYVRTKDGGYYIVQPYRPIPIKKGDTYYPPDGPPVLIEEDTIITLPLIPVNPTPPKNTYPVILVIDEIVILDPGFGYRPGDKLIIDPSNGAIGELVVNDKGQIERVNVTSPGAGFLDLPNLSTDSLTGFNATFSTIFKPIRLEDWKDEIPEGVQPISVVDCVGKVTR